MHDQPPSSRRWDDLARELGLEPEPEPTLPAQTFSPPPLAPPAEADLRQARTPKPEPTAQRDQERGAFIREPVESEFPSSVEEPPGQEGNADAPGPEDRPRRGRRGRRSGKNDRGPRERAAGEEQPDQPAAETRSASEEDADDQPRRRGRGRGRGRGRPRAEEPVPEPESAEIPEPGDSEAVSTTDSELDADEVSDLSGWNVPSWQELISSLYRPER